MSGDVGTAAAPASVLVCAGCGQRMDPDDAYPFRCPRGLAEAAGCRLAVFVPEFANSEVQGKLRAHGAELIVCPRDGEPASGPAGDPCFLRLRRGLARGALPFTCQGSENGLIADGGATLVWEVASALVAAGRTADRLFVQVGGGALAAASIQGLAEAR